MSTGSKLSRKMMVEHFHLPEDVLMEILSRLRVKSLVRFKSVSKTWFRLISSQPFIQLHLDKSSFRPIRRLPRFSTSPCSHIPNPRPAPFSFEVSGSCDGLVCLINHKHGIVHIWNPATRLCKCIPIKRTPDVVSCSWFGHGNKHDDREFKLVLVTVSSIYLFRLYAADDDPSCCSWTSTHALGNFYFTYDGYIAATLVDDTVHWLAHPRLDDRGWTRVGPTVILSYDLVKDEVREIAPPPALTIDSDDCRIGQVHGDLCVMFQAQHETYHQVWAMKEYGVQESWTKLFVVPARYANYHYSSQRIKDDPLLILEDPETVKSPVYDKYVFVESLVSPASRDGAMRRNGQCA